MSKSFQNYINSDDDIKYINDLVITTLSKENSLIKIDFYYNHIFLCAKIAYDLASKYKINPKNVVIAALLHDYAKYDSLKDHELVGSMYARKILESLKFQESDIEIICSSIENHIYGIRGKRSIECQIVADADCISYVKNFEYFRDYEYSIDEKEAGRKLFLKISKICDIISADGMVFIENEIENIKKELEEKLNGNCKCKRFYWKESER